MTEPPTAVGASDPDRLSQQELDRLAFTIADRFAPHLQAAEAAVREAEHGVAEAREMLARAEAAAANAPYQSDPLVFMRATVTDDVEGLARKTTAKKVRASFRYLLDRAVELAEGEVAGYRSDVAATRHERALGVSACQQSEQAALAELESALVMQRRVQDAERAARDGLEILKEKMGAGPA